ncbi:MAG: tRNA (adenosine(37)-N6)-threonylcarbamoyltransferase complex dimerization subunit type 1 TsaB [Synergistaceae bacterium]|jgi:tRNA threonylcarbamoyladenosine biosynthesis protein TsaB|nr:tRNA (adenosine(37)-N6)-threonylcarbamoyltransferase complex dimerization subunit type 1 TsaB [Synergistaceae bacterium]
MPLTLAIDCALRQLNLSLSDDLRLYGDISLHVDVRQSELLPSVVEGFLSSLGVKLPDIGLIAVTTGPGYYTGVRVGLSYASTLAWSLGIRIAPVPTLYAVAFGLLDVMRALEINHPVAPVIDAGKNSLYGAVYGIESSGCEIICEPSFFVDYDFITLLGSIGGETRPVMVTSCDTSNDILKKSAYRIAHTVSSIGRSMASISKLVVTVAPEEARASYLRSPA